MTTENNQKILLISQDMVWHGRRMIEEGTVHSVRVDPTLKPQTVTLAMREEPTKLKTFHYFYSVL